MKATGSSAAPMPVSVLAGSSPPRMLPGSRSTSVGSSRPSRGGPSAGVGASLSPLGGGGVSASGASGGAVLTPLLAQGSPESGPARVPVEGRRPMMMSRDPAEGACVDELGRVVARELGPGNVELQPVRVPGTAWRVAIYQHMGDRKTQEDRFCVVPCLDPESRTPCAFFGVFDGTVGDFASENVKELVIPKLSESPSWRTFRTASARNGEAERLLNQTLHDTYRTVDDALLARCARSQQHYATCTSVTVLMTGDTLTIGHLGDSRIILGKEQVEPGGGRESVLVGEQLTMDHKPDQEVERTRIERCGGMVERLQNHANKPFIRGGDFLMRKALGEQPMQLQYSRAFGAKDLKIFGLSSVPDVKVIRMGRDPAYQQVRYLILASDGLWDVVSSQQAVLIAQHAVSQGQNPSEALVRQALMEVSRKKGRADNITVVCIFWDAGQQQLNTINQMPAAAASRPQVAAEGS